MKYIMKYIKYKFNKCLNRKLIAVPSVWCPSMLRAYGCVFCSISLVYLRVCAYVFKFKVHCGSALESGASGLPYYCSPPVCSPTVFGALAVWWYNIKKRGKRDCVVFVFPNWTESIYSCLFVLMFPGAKYWSDMSDTAPTNKICHRVSSEQRPRKRSCWITQGTFDLKGPKLVDARWRILFNVRGCCFASFFCCNWSGFLV